MEMKQSSNPFFLCLPPEKLGVLQKLADLQKKRHGVDFTMPSYLKEVRPDIIEAPVYLEDQAVADTNREMAENSDVKARSK